jgi:hypothetical protein
LKESACPIAKRRVKIRAMPLETLRVSVHDDLVLLVQGTKSASNAEWAVFLEATSKGMAKHGRKIRVLVFTEGASPNAVQRQMALGAGWKNNPSLVAIVNRDPAGRAILTMFSWFGNTMKAFHPNESENAFEFLSLMPSEIDWVKAELPRLRAVLGI